METSKQPIIWGAVITVVALVIAGLMLGRETGPGKFDSFAQCLGEKGAIFYGAFWCPNCQNQKAKFSSSARLLPYIECSTPDGQGQVPYCTEREITGYPTWEFADGSRLNGDVPLATLSEKTGCALPE